jgi:hypothetical protein
MNEGILVLLIFIGSSAVAIAYSPIGKAIADRIRGRVGGRGSDPALLDEMDDQRARLAEVESRLDFAERALVAGADERGTLRNSSGQAPHEGRP